MIHDAQHTLIEASVTAPHVLRLRFADGETFIVDLAAVIRTHPALAALSDTTVFANAHVDARGGYVVWVPDDLEIAADNLRNIAVEQAGGIGHERLLNWMAQHGLTQARAADAIGISRRMLSYYLSGAKPIPKTVWLACLGWASSAAA